ncbi:MAG: glutathione S-transferase family protein [Alphaproteobacteria bacterium]|nr:MAG: glutathione S-transferase family protein [Alphaproteobacteria bacterium]
MTMLTIFGDARSGNCLKVRWTAERLGLPYRWRDVDIMRGGSRTPEFLAMNPAGQVPLLLLEDGRPLAQSNAILLHLADGSALVPTDRYARAKMLEWLFWEQYSHEPYVAVARFRVLYEGLSVARLDARLVERGQAALVRLEEALGISKCLVGDTLTLADIACVAYTRMAGDGGFDLARLPEVRRWVAETEAVLGLPPYA